jgi:hypothetical protein
VTDAPTRIARDTVHLDAESLSLAAGVIQNAEGH